MWLLYVRRSRKWELYNDRFNTTGEVLQVARSQMAMGRDVKIVPARL